MSKKNAKNPIGIFDSGIGGLTVAHALVNKLPKENIIYFGDTAHLPYGDKSTAAIQAYSVKIAHMLLKQDCKLILIACNSASAAAYDLVKEYVATQALVMNVIDPVVHVLCKDYKHKKIGLIGTRQTVNSNVFKKKIDKLNHGIDLNCHATNLLASAIEEFGNNKVIDSLLEEYFADASFSEIDALVLACTHYPVIKERVNHYFNHKNSNEKNNNPVEIIDPSEMVAKAVYEKLQEEKLVNNQEDKPKSHFYVSDYTESFAANAKKFFGDDITLEHYPLWE